MAEMVGFRFHPTDEELVNYYLRHKILGNESFVRDAINEVNMCRFDPWKLPSQSRIRSSDQVWYFFCPKDNKYLNSRRANRTTESGFWKATGSDRKIRAKGGNPEIIGTKKTLVFHLGRVPNGKRTDWVMHEYHLSFILPNKKPYVVCKVKNKAGERSSIPSINGSETSYTLASDSSNLAVVNATLELNQPIQENIESIPDCSNFDYDLALQLEQEQQGLSFADLQDPNNFSCNHNMERTSPIFNFSEDNLELPNWPEPVDPKFVEELFADECEGLPESFINEYLHNYKPQKSLSGVCAESCSNCKAEAIYTQSNHLTTTVKADTSKQTQHIDMDGFDEVENPANFLQNVARTPSRQIRLQHGISARMLSGYKAAESSESSITSDVLLKNKKSSINKSQREWKMAEDPYKETASSASPQQHFAVNKKGKGSFIHFETTELSLKPNAPSIYLLNILVGVFLFVITVRGFISIR